MRIRWLAILLSFCCLPLRGFTTDPATSAASGPDFQLTLTAQPNGLFIPGDLVSFAFFPQRVEQLTADSFTLEFRLPAGLLLADNFWSQRENIAYRVLPKPTGTQAYPVDIMTRIAPNYQGRQLTVSGNFADFPAAQQSVTFSVAELLSSKADTCLFFQDTTGGAITTILATRREVTARLRGPIDLSPTAPLSISHKKCKAFILKPGKKRDKQQEKCTALHFALNDTTRADYPARYVPGAKKVQGILPFYSHGQPGDTLNISLKTVKGRPLEGIVLTDGKEEILDAVKDAPAYAFTAVLDTATLDRTLHLRARRLFNLLPLPRQYCLVDVERRPATLTLYRDNGPALRQPNGDTTVLLREVVVNNDQLIRWKELSTRRADDQTIFYRILETVDKTGRTPSRRDTLSRDTCAGLYNVHLGAKQRKSQRWVAVDTLLYQATDASQTIVGQRNPLGLQQGYLEVKIPLQLNLGDPDTKDSLIGMAYWVGIGEVPIAAYAALAEEVPPEWAQPGISAPLAAYGLNHPVVLPGLPSSEALFRRDQVRFDFVGTRAREAFANASNYSPLIRRDPKRPNFGVLQGATLRRLNGTTYLDREAGKSVFRFYLAFANQHQINTYNLQLKVVAYYQVFALQDAWEADVSKP